MHRRANTKSKLNFAIQEEIIARMQKAMFRKNVIIISEYTLGLCEKKKKTNKNIALNWIFLVSMSSLVCLIRTHGKSRFIFFDAETRWIVFYVVYFSSLVLDSFSFECTKNESEDNKLKKKEWIKPILCLSEHCHLIATQKNIRHILLHYYEKTFIYLCERQDKYIESSFILLLIPSC